MSNWPTLAHRSPEYFTLLSPHPIVLGIIFKLGESKFFRKGWNIHTKSATEQEARGMVERVFCTLLERASQMS